MFALLGAALLGCSQPREVDRLVVRLIDVVDGARLELVAHDPELGDLALVRGEGGARVRVRLRRPEAWTPQPEATIFGERAEGLAIWSFRAALPTAETTSVRLESEVRGLVAWDPRRKPRPYGWFHSPGGFYPRGFHLALPAGVAPDDLGLVAEFAPTPGLELELASPGQAPPTSALVRWASLAGDSRRSLVVPGGGEVRFELEVPARSRLRFAAGRRAHPWSDGGDSSRIEVELREAAGWRSLRSLTFSGTGAAPASWQDVELPIDGSAGAARVELRFRVPEVSSRGLASHLVAEPVVVAPARRDRRPNLLLIVVDGLRADHVGARDGAASPTPHLDRLARRGLRFANASAAATWTRPSIASMFTGRLPSAHGVEGEDAASRLPRSVPTLAGILREAGWSTVALSANPHLDPAFGVSRGFSRVASGLVDGATLESSLGAALDGRQHEPFFLFGFFMDTHWPWTDRPEDPEAEAIEARVVDAQRLGRAGSHGDGEQAEPTEAEVRKLRALYRENVRYADARIGALLERLRELGLERDTIVVVTADHGEAFGEHGAFFHGWNVHRELEHVPLVVAGPGVPRGVSEEPLSLVHLPALLLDLLGIADAPRAQRSLARRILDGGAAPPPVIETKFRGSDQAALIEGRWKLVLGRRRGAVRLYDLASDPREQADRSAAEPHRVARMRAELERRLAESEADRATSDEPPEEDAEGLGEQLRALGYL
jgi:arylsulfatase